MQLGISAALLLTSVASAGLAASPAAAPGAAAIQLPGPRYQVLRSGPARGPHPTRADKVEIRYVGRLTDGSIFSTSADEGRGLSSFPVRSVIPGFSALVQLMRPGGRWRFTIPGYLAYGRQGRRFKPGEPNLKRDIPADATLIFEVELVAIAPAE
jgi:FKBP-type peptidyl-prolyl cis-trans isomerase